MSMTAEKVAEMLALPERDRAFLAHQLIASLDTALEADDETEWQEVIDRRAREMSEGRVDSRSEEEMIGEIWARLHSSIREKGRNVEFLVAWLHAQAWRKTNVQVD